MTPINDTTSTNNTKDNTMTTKFHGVIPPVVTPLTPNGDLDVASYNRVAQEDVTVGGDFIDLHGFTPGHAPLSAFDAQGDLLAAAGIPSDEIPTVPAGRSSMPGRGQAMSPRP